MKPYTFSLYESSPESAQALRLKTERPAYPISLDGEGSSIFIDPSKTFQTILGFGGAFTEAAALTLQSLSPARQEALLQAYFNPQTGNGYTFGRCHLGSCDFSLGNYHYVERPGDTALDSFSIAHDEAAILPMIRRATEIAGRDLTLMASPWSPPAWMKSTGIMNHGGSLKPEYAAAWAQMYVRFIQAYAEADVPIWGLSVQNEAAATQIWDSCVYTAEDEAAFVADHLGPALAAAGLSDVKIMMWDHNRTRLVQRAAVAMANPETRKYLWGMCYHWYEGDNFDNVRLCRDAWPELHLVFSEGCQENGPHDGVWWVGERYGRSIIHDLNNGMDAWCDWNLILNKEGGPNHVGNLCNAPILVDPETDSFSLQSGYHYIGHFSRFIHPGAQRILCASTQDDIYSTAALNPDGSIAVVIMNHGEHNCHLTLRSALGGAGFAIPAHSIQTVVLTPAPKFESGS